MMLCHPQTVLLARVVSFSGRSFMYARDKQGPSTVPWGTPDLMLTKED